MVFFCDDETKKMHGFRFIHLYCDINDDTKHHNMEFSAWMTKGQKKSKWFYLANVSSKKRTNEFYFTIMKPQVDLISFVFWRKLKTPKKHFEIIWPLQTGRERYSWAALITISTIWPFTTMARYSKKNPKIIRPFFTLKVKHDVLCQ